MRGSEEVRLCTDSGLKTSSGQGSSGSLCLSGACGECVCRLVRSVRAKEAELGLALLVLRGWGLAQRALGALWVGHQRLRGASRQALPEAQRAAWPPRPHAQAALRGNFQASLIPPESLARGRLRVFRALEIPTWPGVLSAGGWVPSAGGAAGPSSLGGVSPGLSTVAAGSPGKKLKSVLTQLNLQLRCDKFRLLIWTSFLKD